jgi:hypothetical protein
LSFCHCHFAIVILPLSFCHCHFAIVILPLSFCHCPNDIFVPDCGAEASKPRAGHGAEQRRRRPPVQEAPQLDSGVTGSMPTVTRVARFFLVHDTKTGKNVTNENKKYQTVIKHPICP